MTVGCQDVAMGFPDCFETISATMWCFIATTWLCIFGTNMDLSETGFDRVEPISHDVGEGWPRHRGRLEVDFDFNF